MFNTPYAVWGSKFRLSLVSENLNVQAERVTAAWILSPDIRNDKNSPTALYFVPNFSYYIDGKDS